MKDNELLVICLDCEEQWDPDYEPSHCICDYPGDDAWALFVKDREGTWVRAMLEALKGRHGNRSA